MHNKQRIIFLVTVNKSKENKLKTNIALSRRDRISHVSYVIAKVARSPITSESNYLAPRYNITISQFPLRNNCVVMMENVVCAISNVVFCRAFGIDPLDILSRCLKYEDCNIVN